MVDLETLEEAGLNSNCTALVSKRVLQEAVDIDSHTGVYTNMQSNSPTEPRMTHTMSLSCAWLFNGPHLKLENDVKSGRTKIDPNYCHRFFEFRVPFNLNSCITTSKNLVSLNNAARIIITMSILSIR